MERWAALAVDMLSGKMSKKVMAMRVPEENAKKYCKICLNLIATIPPATVERNVIRARIKRIGVITMNFIGVEQVQSTSAIGF